RDITQLCLHGASCLEGIEPQRLIAFSKAMEFNQLTDRASAFVGIDAKTVAPDARLAAKGIAPPAEEMLPAAEVSPSGDLFPSPPPPRPTAWWLRARRKPPRPRSSTRATTPSRSSPRWMTGSPRRGAKARLR